MAGELIKQTITKNIVSRLKKIRVDNGYETDLGLNVKQWRMGEFDTNALPAATLNSINSQWSSQVSSRHQWSVDYEIEAVARAEEDPALVLDNLEADLMVALGSEPRIEQQNIAPNARIQITDCEHQVKMADKRIVGIRLRFTATFSTQLWNPYQRDI